MDTIPTRSRLARRLATWAVVCFALAAAVFVILLFFAIGDLRREGMYGGLGVFAVAGLGANPIAQTFIWLGLVFTAGSVGAQVASEAVDRAAAHRAAGPTDDGSADDGLDGETEILSS